jgi:hypothetical protein
VTAPANWRGCATRIGKALFKAFQLKLNKTKARNEDDHFRHALLFVPLFGQETPFWLLRVIPVTIKSSLQLARNLSKG